ncbi:MAG TPA: SRPBCC domain-containing protein [Prosthecobacter sp.]
MMMNVLDPLVYMASPSEQPREWRMRRLLKAHRSKVYEAWTVPALFSHWWGPHAFTNPLCQMDVRAQGAYHVTMRSPDGTDYLLEGRFLELKEPELLVMTMDCSGHPSAWHDVVKPGRDSSEPNPAGEMTLTVTLEEGPDGGTVLELCVGFVSPEIRDTFVRMGIESGWGESLDSLDALLKAAE